MSSKIEWTDETWNPFVGCSKVSPACDNCYAERMACRLAANPKTPTYSGVITDGKWNGRIWSEPESVWMKPFQWKKPRRIFVGSMTDVFHPNVPEQWLDELFTIAASLPLHTFQILTKRPERMREYLSSAETYVRVGGKAQSMLFQKTGNVPSMWLGTEKPFPNVWLGITAENQEQADKRIPVLLDTPAAKRFVSIEPMLGPVDLSLYLSDLPFQCFECGHREWDCACACRECGLVNPEGVGYCHNCKVGYLNNDICVCSVCGNETSSPSESIDWVIAGGESGPGARPSHPDWFRSLRDQCKKAGVPFFFKQWGEWAPDCLCGKHRPCPETPRPTPGRMGCMFRCGKKASGHLLDGQEWRQIPEVE